MEYVQRRFSEIPSLGGVAGNRDPSNNSRCNNLATNVPTGSNNVANNDKINLEKKRERRHARWDTNGIRDIARFRWYSFKIGEIGEKFLQWSLQKIDYNFYR